MDIERYINGLVEEAIGSGTEPPHQDLSWEAVLKGLVIELWSDSPGERF